MQWLFFFLISCWSSLHVPAPFLIWEQQIKVLCQSYLMGLAPQRVFFLASSQHLFYTSFLFSTFPFLAVFSPPSLSSACVCVTWRTTWGAITREKNKKNENLCWPTCSSRQAYGAVCCSSGAWTFTSHHSFLCSVLSAPPSSAGAQNGLAFPGASGHKRRPRLLQSYQGTDGWVRMWQHNTH